MGPATGRRGGTDVVGDEGLAGRQGVVGTGLEARLDPVEDGAEEAPERERGVQVQGDDPVGGRGFRDGERDFGSGLGLCPEDQAGLCMVN